MAKKKPAPALSPVPGAGGPLPPLRNTFAHGRTCICKGSGEVAVLEGDDRAERRPTVVFSFWRSARPASEPITWAPGGLYVDVCITDARVLPARPRRRVPCPSCQDPTAAIGQTLVVDLLSRISVGTTAPRAAAGGKDGDE